jgi:hypothetical protein
MKPISKTTILKAALAFLLPILPAAADYCTFDNSNCIDGLAQVSVSFQFDAISPAPLLFYYGFDAGWGSPSDENSGAVKVGYWLQYDRGTVTDFNSNMRGINWTTEVALRIGNLGGYVGGANNGCDGVWGDACSENLKTFLRSSLFNLSTSGQPYDLPLDTVLQPLTTGNPGPFIDGCPSTLFELDQIPTYGKTSLPSFSMCAKADAYFRFSCYECHNSWRQQRLGSHKCCRARQSWRPMADMVHSRRNPDGAGPRGCRRHYSAWAESRLKTTQ